MIASLIPYIQFMAAIYVTVSMDNMISRRFWTPNYYGILMDRIREHQTNCTNRLQNKINDAAKAKFNALENNSRKKGFVMLLFAVSLLIANGFVPEQTVNEAEQSINALTIQTYSFSLFCYLLLTFILYVIICVKDIRWRWSLIYFSIVYVAYIATPTKLFACTVSFVDFTPYIKYCVVVFLGLPFLMQLAINWLYSTGYIIYIDDKLSHEMCLYEQAKNAFYTKKSKALPNEYKNLAADMGVQQTVGDEQITALNKFLENRLSSITDKPEIFRLIKTSWKDIEEKKDMKDVKLADEDSEITGMPTNTSSTSHSHHYISGRIDLSAINAESKPKKKSSRLKRSH